ncbi:hypothetical protein SLNSH_22770 [Alsobacter soli]|uniref:Uncharacterized protein n=1 Tax=Alsobacter soli TaxID=2109933 RepID=A0A2T1HM15_9HYPH|nr:hypothetical protein [Alsobacter soli]PSC02687.1 hypothetical protein SLNSH_22770 [Alsobacter soli]
MAKKKPASLELAMATGPEQSADNAPAATPQPSKAEKLTVYVSRRAAKLIKQMALDNDKRTNDYLREGINLMLAKYGHPSLEEMED